MLLQLLAGVHHHVLAAVRGVIALVHSTVGSVLVLLLLLLLL
jgi:hypothetical protein